ncbi:MAG TPA: endonuclease III [Gemmatimonadaceae bacterium]
MTPAPPKKGKKSTAAKKRPKLLKGAALQKQARDIERLLRKEYPGAKCELDFRNAFELVAATILSAQCTDKRVNMVTPALFARFPDAAALAGADLHEVEDLIKSTGFYHNKAKSLVGMARALMTYHAGEVPRTMDDLVVLPGIGRKTANVVLGNAFGINEGVVVDTHVARLATRLGLTKETDPVKIEHALMPIFPRESWTLLSHLLIWHGRRVCDAKKPRCSACVLKRICPSAT